LKAIRQPEKANSPLADRIARCGAPLKLGTEVIAARQQKNPAARAAGFSFFRGGESPRAGLVPASI
jgi:hypothetical protein